MNIFLKINKEALNSMLKLPLDLSLKKCYIISTRMGKG